MTFRTSRRQRWVAAGMGLLFSIALVGAKAMEGDNRDRAVRDRRQAGLKKVTALLVSEGKQDDARKLEVLVAIQEEIRTNRKITAPQVDFLLGTVNSQADEILKSKALATLVLPEKRGWLKASDRARVRVALLGALWGKSFLVRHNALSLLGMFGLPEDRHRVERLLTDPDKMVRDQAAALLRVKWNR
jgi:HEAT repeat protein